MNRRTFLSLAASVVALDAGAQSGSIPIIDTHIHLFDPRRPQGVPWPLKDDKIMYRPALPDRYRSLTKGLGIVGAIEIECSPWLEDNQWVLDICRQGHHYCRNRWGPGAGKAGLPQKPGTVSQESAVSGHSVWKPVGQESC